LLARQASIANSSTSSWPAVTASRSAPLADGRCPQTASMIISRCTAVPGYMASRPRCGRAGDCAHRRAASLRRRSPEPGPAPGLAPASRPCHGWPGRLAPGCCQPRAWSCVAYLRN
jgi:hypothetical protein